MSSLDNADKENIYQTVYKLEGMRHPVLSPEALDKAADAIAATMRGLGLQVREQVFYVQGWDRPFRNIEGSLGPVGEKPAAVLTAHYDTVETPGANDDAAGVAVMLEVARMLSQLPAPPPVYFVAVTLEEGDSPEIYSKVRESKARLGVTDGQDRYTGWQLSKYARQIQGRMTQLFFGGADIAGAYIQALEECGEDIPASLKTHITEIAPLYAGMTVDSAIGKRNRIGSHRWVQEALQTRKKISFCINIDEPGNFRYEPKTQGLLGGMGFESFSKGYRLDPVNQVGNFSLIVTHKPSEHIGQVFAEYCESEDINLPYAWIAAPLTYEQIITYQPMGLNSDHAPFWQAGIPALFIFDSSMGRFPYVHTPADTIDRIDFDRLAEIARAVAATVCDERTYRPA